MIVVHEVLTCGPTRKVTRKDPSATRKVCRPRAPHAASPRSQNRQGATLSSPIFPPSKIQSRSHSSAFIGTAHRCPSRPASHERGESRSEGFPFLPKLGLAKLSEKCGQKHLCFAFIPKPGGAEFNREPRQPREPPVRSFPALPRFQNHAAPDVHRIRVLMTSLAGRALCLVRHFIPGARSPCIPSPRAPPGRRSMPCWRVASPGNTSGDCPRNGLLALRTGAASISSRRSNGSRVA